MKSLAHQLRKHPMSLELQNAGDEDTDNFQEIRRRFKQITIDLMKKALEEDTELMKAVIAAFAENARAHL